MAPNNEVRCFALYRGHDRNGVPQPQWKQIAGDLQTLEAAKDECEGLFGSGLLWHPSRAEFLVCTLDGTPLWVARPPHAKTLQWEAAKVSLSDPIPEAGSATSSPQVDGGNVFVDGEGTPLPAFVHGAMAGMVGFVRAGSA